MLFTDKYAPKTFNEFIGNPKIVERAKQWASDWSKGKTSKPLLLHGSPGIGKTALAYVIASEFQWQLFELNASDFRNKEVIERIVGGAALNSSFFGGKRLVLMDEVDGIQKRKDKGGLPAIQQIIKEAKNPIILTANKIYSKDRKLDSIKFYTEELKFEKIRSTSIAKHLKEICEKEGIEFDLEVLSKLAEQCNGDLRSALLDLQNLSIVGNKITLQDLKEAGYRERETDIFNLMTKIFKSKDLNEIRKARFSVDVDNDLLKKWVEENIPRIYKGEDLRNAFNVLSRADIFDGRIFRRQHYGFLRYSTELMTSGVALAKEKEYHGWLQVQFPSIIKGLSKSMALRNLKKSIAEQIKNSVHGSSNEIIKSDLDFIKILMKNKNNAEELIAQFDFNEEQAAFLLDAKKDSTKIKKLVEKGKELRAKNIKPIKGIMALREEEVSNEEFEEIIESDEAEEKEVFEEIEEVKGKQTKLF